jgi:hypothetical protein
VGGKGGDSSHDVAKQIVRALNMVLLKVASVAPAGTNVIDTDTAHQSFSSIISTTIDPLCVLPSCLTAFLSA